MNKVKPIMPDDLEQEVLYNLESIKKIYENVTFVRWKRVKDGWVLKFLHFDSNGRKTVIHLRPNNVITGRVCVFINE
jgi:hypothetical protein